MKKKIFHGDILYARTKDQLCSHEDSYLVVIDGLVEGIYDKFPSQHADGELIDHGRGVLIPAFSDLHVHAPQYVQRGLGMDCLLSDWLNNYTFPQESRFADMEYAKRYYDAFVDEMILHGTFHASVFATIHRPATNYLFRRMEEKGMYGYVGKVNMDVNSPAFLCETTEESLQETEQFLLDHQDATTVKPILTPRFAPTCSPELISGLGKLAEKYKVGVQTHVVESKWEAQESLNLFPDCASDSAIYERAGLMDHGPSIFAHVIFPTEDDLRVMGRHNCVAVHCPDATTNIIAGIMPLSALQDQNINVALGSDVGGGHGIGVYKQISRAVQLSKMKEFYEPEVSKTITFANAFYCATKAGGSVFGKVGSFEPGYHFNALVIDNMEDECISLTPSDRIERFCYIGDDRNIVARYIDGKAL